MITSFERHEAERHEAFRALHMAPIGFVLPNVWDAGSALVVANSGFAAIATTSAGIAFSLGKPDYDARNFHLAVTRDEMFDRVRQIVNAVTVPVSGDLEAGYGDAPEAVAETITMAIASGLSGANIEDKDPRTGNLYDERLAVERIAAARSVIVAHGVPFVLTARTDAFLVSAPDARGTSIRRANLFHQAGADCLYPPGVGDLDVVKTLVREIAGPLNIVTGLGGARLSPRALIDSGVQRVSVGGAIARSALGIIRASARELSERGTIDFTDVQIGQRELNVLFAQASKERIQMAQDMAQDSGLRT